MQNKQTTEQGMNFGMRKESARELAAHRLPLGLQEKTPVLATMIVDKKIKEGYKFELTAEGKEKLRIEISRGEEKIIPTEDHVVMPNSTNRKGPEGLEQ